MTFATWNPADKDPLITLSGGDLVATADGSANNQAVRDTLFKSAGKLYCELTVTSNGGLVATVPRLGISTSAYDVATGGDLGQGATEYAYEANGNKINNGSATAYGASFTTSDVISVVLDLDAGTLNFWKNGVDQGEAYSGISGTFAITFHDVGGSVITANFGASAFTYTPPAGYSGWSDASNDLAATIPAPLLSMGGAAALVVTSLAPRLAMSVVGMHVPVPMPILFMEGADELAVVTPMPSLQMLPQSVGSLEAIALPPQLAMAGDSYFISLSALLPAVTVAIQGETGSVSDVGLSVPAPRLALGSAPVLSVSVPISLALSGVSGSLGVMAAPHPLAQVSMSLVSSNSGGLKIELRPSFDATALTESLGVFRGIQVRVRPLFTAVSGNDAVINISIPVSAAFLAYGPYQGTMGFHLPTPVLDLQVLSEIADIFATWVMNARHKALTEYGGFEFNSYAVFRNVPLSAGAAGIVPLASANDDNGAPIVALARTGKEGFGSSYNKRLPRLYVTYASPGNMHFSTYTSQGGKRTYLLPGNSVSKVQTRRVPIGRGPKSPHWQLEVTNPSGDDFTLSALQAYPEKGRRRVV